MLKIYMFFIKTSRPILYPNKRERLHLVPSTSLGVCLDLCTHILLLKYDHNNNNYNVICVFVICHVRWPTKQAQRKLRSVLGEPRQKAQTFDLMRTQRECAPSPLQNLSYLFSY